MQTTSLYNIPQELRSAIEEQFLNSLNTSYQISSVLNIHVNTVHAIGIHLLGKEQLDSRELLAKEALLSQVSDLQANGMVLVEICSKLHITKSYIYRARKALLKLEHVATTNADVVEIVSISDHEPIAESNSVITQPLTYHGNTVPAKAVSTITKDQDMAINACCTRNESAIAGAISSVSTHEHTESDKSANIVSFKFRGSEFSYIPGSPGSSQTEESVLRLLEQMVARGML